MSLLEQLREKREDIYAVAEPYGISNIRVFGSVARGEETPESDIDLLVHFDLDKTKSGFAYVGAWRAVREYIQQEAKIQRDVDWVSDGGIHPLLKDRILGEAIPL
jgi:hypothetical protein